MNETNEKKKVSTKTNVKRITSVLLIFALVITGIFAFLTATDSKVNTFKIGNVDISLQEYDGETPWWETDDTGHTTDELTDDINENGNGIADNMEKLVPGQYVGKEPVITNLGTLDSWTYLVVAVPTAQEADIVQQENSNGNVNIEGLSGEDVSIDMYAYAIQPGYITGNVEETALSVWNKYADYSEGTYGKYETMFGAEATDVSDRIELFKKIVVDDATNEKSEFVIANNTDWKQIGTVYKSADGKNYYVYALNNKLAPEADTPTLFNGFKLIEAIGEVV